MNELGVVDLIKDCLVTVANKLNLEEWGGTVIERDDEYIIPTTCS